MGKINNNNTARGVFGRIGQVRELALLIVLVVIFIFFSLASGYFFTVKNLTNILGQIALPLISAVGLSMLIISGEVDISIGSLQAVVALPLIVVMNRSGSFLLGLVCALIVGTLVGVINGVLVTKLKINSLIATLGMYYTLRGVVWLVTGKVAIVDEIKTDSFFMLGNMKLFKLIPYSSILMFAVLLLFMFILKRTTFGRRLYAVGGNAEVSRSAGINPERIKFTAFILCSFLASISAVLLASRLGSAQHLAGTGFEFQVVAAVVLGGVSLSGGVGTLLGAFIGVFIMGIIQNGLGMLNVDTMWQLVITGVIIIFAVFLDEFKKRH